MFYIGCCYVGDIELTYLLIKCYSHFNLIIHAQQDAIIVTAQDKIVNHTDLFIIGGGINGCGIARDAAGRGLSVRLAEQGDLAQATSSASSKLFHGGLRYLEYYEFGLVRKALEERETLLSAMPHISHPMRFVMPHHKGLRPRWLIRLGLFMYDHLGKRKHLAASRNLDLRKITAGKVLQKQYRFGFEYSDCWVHDSRLVSLNARDAAQHGAQIMTRTKVIKAERHQLGWCITCQDVATNRLTTYTAKMLVNAAGPWIQQVINNQLPEPSAHQIRLVRGSHIVVPKLYEHDQPYILQGHDGRIVFLLPFEQDYTLIGTTDIDHDADPQDAVCSTTEATYLCDFVNEYLQQPVSTTDIVWSYAGVRPLFDDGAGNASAATRDYVLELQDHNAIPLINVFGGKITTYRKLAEAVMEKLLAHAKSNHWTAGVPLPGGDFAVDGRSRLVAQLRDKYTYLDQAWAYRLVTTYGTDSFNLLADKLEQHQLGKDFGANLTQTEITWLMQHEFAQTVEDVIWRRTKLGLRLTQQQQQDIAIWMHSQQEAAL